jgi:hypothetical protein
MHMHAAPGTEYCPGLPEPREGVMDEIKAAWAPDSASRAARRGCLPILLLAAWG